MTGCAVRPNVIVRCGAQRCCRRREFDVFYVPLGVYEVPVIPGGCRNVKVSRYRLAVCRCGLFGFSVADVQPEAEKPGEQNAQTLLQGSTSRKYSLKYMPCPE